MARFSVFTDEERSRQNTQMQTKTLDSTTLLQRNSKERIRNAKNKVCKR